MQFSEKLYDNGKSEEMSLSKMPLIELRGMMVKNKYNRSYKKPHEKFNADSPS